MLCNTVQCGVKVLENDENDDDIHITAAVDCRESNWEDWVQNKNA